VLSSNYKFLTNGKYSSSSAIPSLAELGLLSQRISSCALSSSHWSSVSASGRHPALSVSIQRRDFSRSGDDQTAYNKHCLVALCGN
jgi:hypothetical protein